MLEYVIVIEIRALQTGPVTVQVLTLSSGRVNALDVEVLEELTGAVRELQSSGAGALVVTGAGKVFSAGVDLNRVLQGGADYTDRLIPALSDAFDALFCYPGPTVAAINGAAIAGGCVLACACDRRLISPDAQDRSIRGPRRRAVSGRRAGGGALRVRRPRRGRVARRSALSRG